MPPPDLLRRGYELRDVLGAGGFGTVYRAWQPAVHREVAVKVIKPQLADHPAFILRFEREAQTIARLEHPRIVPLYDFWREPGGAFLVMRLMHGGSLAQGNEPLAPAEALRMLREIAEALDAAHRKGIVHRDIKPANLLLDEERHAYLADFGLARQVLGESLSAVGTVAGTPYYMAPEHAAGQPATPRSDLFSLGVTAFRLFAGERPAGPTGPGGARLGWGVPPQDVRMLDPDLPEGVNAVLRRATAPDPRDRPGSALELVSLLAAALAGSEDREDWPTRGSRLDAEASRPLENPYKGLRAFEESDAADFFGRETLVRRLLARLGGVGSTPMEGEPPPEKHRDRFIAVVGPSGCGKSSAVKAGLLPALRRGSVRGSDRWLTLEMFPGSHPLEELEVGLLRLAAGAAPDFREQLRRDPRGLLRAARLVLPDRRGGEDPAELLVVVDQFEEVFTLAEDPAEAAHFVASLCAAAKDPRSRVRIVVTLRADFYDRPLLHPELGDLLRRSTEVVIPLTPAELARAVEAPAERAGARFERDLVAAIVADVSGQPGALPLLQYALTELFERRDGALLTRSAYDAIGGISGALARRAEEIYASLGGEGQAAAKQLLLRLVLPAEEGTGTRRRVQVAELESLSRRPAEGDRKEVPESPPPPDGRSAMAHVIGVFGASRLLSFDRDPVTHGPTVEVAHEALLEAWPRLREWVAESRADLRLERLLGAAAAEWREAGEEPSYLLDGTRLQQFEGWAGTSGVALSAGERAFLAASVARREQAAEQERERQEREVRQEQERGELELGAARRLAETEARAASRLRRRGRVLALAFGAAAVLLAIAVAAGLRSRRSFERAEWQRLIAEANGILAAGGNAELAALLSIRALRSGYSAPGDALLVKVSDAMYARRFIGHQGPDHSVAFSSDGRFVLTASGSRYLFDIPGSPDHLARLWDVQTGEELWRFIGHAGGIGSVALSPDGAGVLTGHQDGTVRLWSATTGRELCSFLGPAGGVLSVAFSPDGSQIVSTGWDPTARIWDVATGREVQRLSGHTDAVSGAAFSPDGRLVVTSGGESDWSVRLWEAATGLELFRFEDRHRSKTSVAFSGDGKQVVAGGWGGSAHVWDVATGAVVRDLVGHAGPVLGVAFSPDGRQVLTGSQDQSARLFDVDSGKEVRRFTGHTEAVIAVAFSPDGESVITGSRDGTARLWERSTEHPSRLVHGTAPASMLFSPDGKALFTGGRDGVIRQWNVATGREHRRFIGHTGTVSWLGTSAGGAHLLSDGFDDSLRVWDIETGNELRRYSNEFRFDSYVANENVHYVSCVLEGVATVREVESGRELARLGDPDHPIRQAWLSADGRFLQARSCYPMQPCETPEGRFQRLLDVRTARELGSWDFPTDLSFLPDGENQLIASPEEIVVWDMDRRVAVRRFSGHSGAVIWADVSPDGRHVLIEMAASDRTPEIWDIERGAKVAHLPGQSGSLVAGAFSPDGRYVATSSNEMTRLWETATGREVRVLTGHTGSLTGIAFSPDGQRIATTSEDGTARLWDTDYRDTVRRVCARLVRDLTATERSTYGITDASPTCPAP